MHKLEIVLALLVASLASISCQYGRVPAGFVYDPDAYYDVPDYLGYADYPYPYDPTFSHMDLGIPPPPRTATRITSNSIRRNSNSIPSRSTGVVSRNVYTPPIPFVRGHFPPPRPFSEYFYF